MYARLEFILMRSSVVVCFLFWLLMVSAVTAQGPIREDVLLFHDGDRITGELLRIEFGSAVFRTNKTADLTVDLSQVQDLQCKHRFAVLKYGVPVSRANAVIGTIEVRGDNLIVTTDDGRAVTLVAGMVGLAINDVAFEREVSRRPPALEGWSIVGMVGGSIVKSTEDGTALNTEVQVTRQVPGVDYLPVRHTTSFGVRDTYEQVTRRNLTNGVSIEEETHVFHASLEQNQYLHERLFALALYEFDRNYSQGLQAGNVLGLGVGWTVVKNHRQRVSLKTDLHETSQGFMEPSDNVNFLGQQLAVTFDQALPRSIDFSGTLSYSPSYTRPHDYSASTRGLLTVPLFWRFSLAITAEDDYLNNAQAGSRRNSFRGSTGLRFTH